MSVIFALFVKTVKRVKLLARHAVSTSIIIQVNEEKFSVGGAMVPVMRIMVGTLVAILAGARDGCHAKVLKIYRKIYERE